MYNQAVFCLMLFTASVISYTKPDTRCEINDIKCLTKIGRDIINTAILGSQELGLESLDPIHHELIKVEGPAVTYSLKDLTVTGLKDLVTNEFKFIPPTNFNLDFTLPICEMSGKLKIEGELHNTPIKANIKCFLKATNVHIQLNTTNEGTKKDGKTYIKNKRFDVKAELLGTIHVDQETLFNETEKLPEAFLQYINDNPKVLMEISKDQITSANMKKLLENTDKLFQTVSVEEIVLLHS